MGADRIDRDAIVGDFEALSEEAQAAMQRWMQIHHDRAQDDARGDLFGFDAAIAEESYTSVFDVPGHTGPVHQGRVWLVTNVADRTTRFYVTGVPFSLGSVKYLGGAMLDVLAKLVDVDPLLERHRRGELHRTARRGRYLTNERNALLGIGTVRSDWPVKLGQVPGWVTLATDCESGRTTVQVRRL